VDSSITYDDGVDDGTDDFEREPFLVKFNVQNAGNDIFLFIVYIYIKTLYKFFPF